MLDDIFQSSAPIPFCWNRWWAQSKFTLNLTNFKRRILFSYKTQEIIVLLKLIFFINFNLLPLICFFSFFQKMNCLYNTQETLPKRNKINEVHTYIPFMYLNNYIYLEILKLEMYLRMYYPFSLLISNKRLLQKSILFSSSYKKCLICIDIYVLYEFPVTKMGPKRKHTLSHDTNPFNFFQISFSIFSPYKFLIITNFNL